MANHTTYTAAGRREAEARRAEQHAAREAALAAGTFEEYLDEIGVRVDSLADVDADLLAAWRDDFARLVARVATA